MKRFFLLCTALTVAIFGAYSQRPSNFWTIKAGVNFSTFANSDYSSEALTGFNVGVNRAFSISDQSPIFFQTGLAMEMKGAKNSYSIDGVEFKNTTKVYALEVPMLMNIGFDLSQKSTLRPFVGLYYSFALGGRIEADGESTNPFKKKSVTLGDGEESMESRIFNRSDFGVRVGVDYKYTKYSIGIAYDLGLTNVYAKKYRAQNYEANTGSFSINLGYFFD
ncbi:MAG: outer membrane beta-barrel protein [Rikenellaceae bacterium]